MYARKLKGRGKTSIMKILSWYVLRKPQEWFNKGKLDTQGLWLSRKIFSVESWEKVLRWVSCYKNFSKILEQLRGTRKYQMSIEYFYACLNYAKMSKWKNKSSLLPRGSNI